MKRLKLKLLKQNEKPAAFGRLCVETAYIQAGVVSAEPDAFGRLCVETSAKKPNAR